MLYKYFDPLLYVFAHKTLPSSNPYTVTINREEFWAFVKRCKLTSPYLSLAEIDVMVSSIGVSNKKLKDKPMHQPNYQIKLGQFLEIVVRIALLRQKNWQKAASPLPDCLSELVEDKIIYYEKVEDKDAEDKSSRLRFETPVLGIDKDGNSLAPDEWLLEYHVRKMLEIHRSNLRKLFTKWAQNDEVRPNAPPRVVARVELAHATHPRLGRPRLGRPRGGRSWRSPPVRRWRCR